MLAGTLCPNSVYIINTVIAIGITSTMDTKNSGDGMGTQLLFPLLPISGSRAHKGIIMSSGH